MNEGMAMGGEGRMSAIIVNYRTPELTLKCVTSLLKFHVVEAQDIVVVDNKSPDESLVILQRELKGIKVIDSGRNAGFSAGINIGAAYATREYLLVLNPDTYFEDSNVAQALALMDKYHDVGIVGLNLVYPTGSRQYSARRFYSALDIIGRRLPIGKYWPLKSRIDEHLMVSSWEANAPFEADWVMGTGFIVRRALFEQIGRMDEAYFLYMEDVDLCARVWGAGSKVVCIPQVKLVHDHQRSSAAGPLSNAGRMHLKSLSIFAKKYRLPLFNPPSPERILRS
jgi:N-acetylglucosaminyl-diphospho-decaprenol L-rhamnosyltransferase